MTSENNGPHDSIDPSTIVIRWMNFIAMELYISEHDEAGRDIAAYVSAEGSERIELIVCLVHSWTLLLGQGRQAYHKRTMIL